MKAKTVTQMICKGCTLPAKHIEKVEILPGGGISFRAIHEGGTVHTWEQYGSLANYFQPKKKHPIRIICPKCGVEGRVNHYINKKKKTKFPVSYYVTHEKIGGMWGQDETRPKHRRCFIDRPEQRQELLFRMGRLLEPIHRKRGRPRKKVELGK